jgi:hypothetical protein
MSALDALTVKFSEQQQSNADVTDDAHTASPSLPSDRDSLSHTTHAESIGSSHLSDSEDDAASARSISLSTPPESPRVAQAFRIPAVSNIQTQSLPSPSRTDDQLTATRSAFLSASSKVFQAIQIPKVSPTSASRISTPSSPPKPETSVSPPPTRASNTYTLDTDFSSEVDDISFLDRQTRESSITSAAQSVYDEPAPVTYPPTPQKETGSDTASISYPSASKSRPESLVISLSGGSLVLGIALVDFNHLVGSHAPRPAIAEFCLSRWAQTSNFHRERYLMTRTSPRSSPSSLFPMVLTWYANRSPLNDEFSTCR